jgi:hypothetical protein
VINKILEKMQEGSTVYLTCIFEEEHRGCTKLVCKSQSRVFARFVEIRNVNPITMSHIRVLRKEYLESWKWCSGENDFTTAVKKNGMWGHYSLFDTDSRCGPTHDIFLNTMIYSATDWPNRPSAVIILMPTTLEAHLKGLRQKIYRSIFTAMICLKTCGICRDLCTVIGKIVWNSRFSAEWHKVF